MLRTAYRWTVVRLARMRRALQAVLSFSGLALATMTGLYGWLAYVQLHEAVDQVIAQDADAATTALIFGLALIWLAKMFGAFTISSTVDGLLKARKERVERRTEELASGGTMTGDELRDLADNARRVRDREEAEALYAAGLLVDRREAERKRDEALTMLKRANEATRAELDRARAERHSNTGSFRVGGIPMTEIRFRTGPEDVL